MLKILSTKQIREVDEFTIKNEPVASIDLMERACRAFTDWFVERFPKENTILIVCGTGNNGGDGLGIARLLNGHGYSISVCIAQQGKSQSTDFRVNLERLPRKIKISTITASDGIEFPLCNILIDALFGSGLSRPVEGFFEELVRKINALDVQRIAVDCPSGFIMDSFSEGVAIKAQHTVAFQVPRLSFLFPQSYDIVGQWNLVDIGLDKRFIESLKSNCYLMDEIGIRKILKQRRKFNHKGNHGHSLIIAGSKGKIGANILATKAALRIGSGLVTSLSPGCGYTAIQSSVPEAMVIIDPSDDNLTELPDLSPFNSIGIGPGIGTSAPVVSMFSLFLNQNISGCVFDADALNLLSSHKELQNVIPWNSILTPHPGEFKRMVGEWRNDFERLEKQISLASRLKSIVILKGAHTSIALPNGEVYFNSTGNPAMATGGSGDVLTGILTGLRAQGYSPKEASIVGVYVHGLAGDLAVKNRATLIASDIVEEIPRALRVLQPT